MSTPGLMYVYDPGEPRYVLLKGALRAWLIERRQPAYYAPADRGWWLRRERLDEVLALAELDHIVVRLRDRRSAA